MLQFNLSRLEPCNTCERCLDREASIIISRRCDLFRWSAVFRRCCRRRQLPLVHWLPLEAIF